MAAGLLTIQPHSPLVFLAVFLLLKPAAVSFNVTALSVGNRCGSDGFRCYCGCQLCTFVFTVDLPDIMICKLFGKPYEFSVFRFHSRFAVYAIRVTAVLHH